MMKLAIFDLDNTLIAGDSDHAWGEFLVARGVVDKDGIKRRMTSFMPIIVQAHLDIIAYSEFVLVFQSWMCQLWWMPMLNY
jgi:phosphoserine phosphatase